MLHEVFDAKMPRSTQMLFDTQRSVNCTQTRDKENVILARLAELSVTFVKVRLNISPIDLIE